jgi:hypothetical protein
MASAGAAASGARRVPKTKQWTQGKARKRQAMDADESDVGIEMEVLVDKTKQLWKPISTDLSAYDMDLVSDRHRLAADLWRGGYFASAHSIREENSILTELIEATIANSSTPSADKQQQFAEGKRRLVDGILINIVRAQSQKKIPLLTAALGIVGLCNSITRENHDAISSFMKGATPSEKWLTDFIAEAMAHRPEPEDEEMIPGLHACVFDNLQMQMDYHSYMVDGESGQQLKMTTWMSCPIPRRLAPNLDFDALCTFPPAT